METTKPGFALALVALLTVTAPAQVFVGSEDFNSGLTIPNGNWDYGYRLHGNTNGLLGVTASRLDFTKAAGSDGSYLIGWNNDHSTGTLGSIDPASFTTSWQMDLTVTNTLAVASGTESAVIGFEITDSTHYYEFVLSSTNGGHWFHVEDTGANVINPAATATTDVQLRMAWDAGAQTLSTYYSTDGSTYTLAHSFNPVTTWSGNDLSSGFWFETFALSNIPDAITAGSMYADNFSLAAIPEPSTHAAICGLGALGLAVRRRRQIARPAA
jgi:hypothetical protein